MRRVLGTSLVRGDGTVPVDVPSSLLLLAIRRLPESIRRPWTRLPKTNRSYRRFARNDEPLSDRTTGAIVQYRRLTILGSTPIDLAVWAITDAMHRPVMPLVHFLLLARIQVVHTDPGIGRRTDDEPVPLDRV